MGLHLGTSRASASDDTYYRHHRIQPIYATGYSQVATWNAGAQVMYRYSVSYAVQTEAGYTLATQVLDRVTPIDDEASLQRLCADLAPAGSGGASIHLLRLTLISEPDAASMETTGSRDRLRAGC